jgi:hypothetical protein
MVPELPACASRQQKRKSFANNQLQCMVAVTNSGYLYVIALVAAIPESAETVSVSGVQIFGFRAKRVTRLDVARAGCGLHGSRLCHATDKCCGPATTYGVAGSAVLPF